MGDFMLRSIIYISEMVEPFKEAAVGRLLDAARPHRENAGITGILFCFSDRFIELLEGPPEAVGELFDRIRLDVRHRHVTTVQDTTIAARAYDRWNIRTVRNEELTAAERGIIFHALHAFEPHTLLAPKLARLDGPMGAAMNKIMARVIPAPPATPEAAEAIDNLLYAAELFMVRSGTVAELTLENVANDARVSLGATRRYFPAVDDLVRTCVLRILALKHQEFLVDIAARPFRDTRQLARAITDFIVSINSRIDGVTPEMNEHIARTGRHFTSDTAWIVADATSAGLAHRGAGSGPTAERVAVAIVATDAAAHALADRNPDHLADPMIRELLFDICQTSLDGPEHAMAERLTA